MGNADREAFEAWFCAEFGIAPSACTPESTYSWYGWQAARQHEAQQPQEVVERVAKAIQARYWQGDLPISISDAPKVCRAFAKAAISAYQQAIFKEPGHE